MALDTWDPVREEPRLPPPSGVTTSGFSRTTALSPSSLICKQDLKIGRPPQARIQRRLPMFFGRNIVSELICLDPFHVSCAEPIDVRGSAQPPYEWAQMPKAIRFREKLPVGGRQSHAQTALGRFDLLLRGSGFTHPTCF